MVTLNGKIKDFMDFMEGVYLLQPNQINGKCHWINENGSLAIWYDCIEDKGNWNIGAIENLGSEIVAMYSCGDSDKPLEAATWMHFDEDENKWCETTDVFILPIPGI